MLSEPPRSQGPWTENPRFRGTRNPALALGFLALAFAIVTGSAGCYHGQEGSDGSGSVETAPPPPAYQLTVLVLGEGGLPLPGARWTLGPGGAGAGEAAGAADAQGRIVLKGLREPGLIIVAAPGFLEEPLVVDRSQSGKEVALRMLRETGPLGERRIVLQLGGDAMLGRRYLEPTSDETARVSPGDGGASARGVVAAIAPLFRAAHLRSVNLETVVGTFEVEEAYPAKRFLLLSPPETADMLEVLGADLVTLGNNHARDWLDEGISATLGILDEAGLPHVGAAADEEAARRTLIVESAGYRVGVISCTTVNGDFVNDSYPDDDDPEPPDLDPENAWQYEFRTFGFKGPTSSLESRPRRVGGFWREFREMESTAVNPGEVALLWREATRVYPELQDWVARRGHGGANPYSSSALRSDIAALRSDGCDLVIVHLHAGFQFFEVKSELVETAAHDAIDEGADMVVGHHPHVLQGFEWYKGRLIAHSLGNFVFDQDFLSTFASAVLRVVFQESEVLEARVFPVVLDRYRPVPLGGDSAVRVLRMLQERSTLPLRSERLHGVVRNLIRERDASTVTPRFLLEGNSARLLANLAGREHVEVTLEPGRILDLSSLATSAGGLTRSRAPSGAPLPGLLLGRDLFGWGSFEDPGADGEIRGGTHWVVQGISRGVVPTTDAPSGVHCLRFQRDEDNSHRIFVRSVARVPLIEHRIHKEEDEAVPADGEPSYSFRMQAKLSGGGEPILRIAFYHFDDTNPSEDPTSLPLGTVEEALEVPPDRKWHDIVRDFPGHWLEPVGGFAPNAALVYLGFAPPAKGDSVLLVDDVQFIEWRRAEDLPDADFDMDCLRLTGAASMTFELDRRAP